MDGWIVDEDADTWSDCGVGSNYEISNDIIVISQNDFFFQRYLNSLSGSIIVGH